MLLPSRRADEHGQILVFFVLALVAIIAFAGLLIDGSAVLAQQRIAQNGADSAANAGGLVIADGLDKKTVHTNHDVFVAIDGMATANGLEDWTGEYTNNVGAGMGIAIVDNSVPTPTGASGVKVNGNREVGTTFSRVVGINSLLASATATVLAGPTSTECVVDEDGCTLLPITFPVQVSECDGHGNLVPGNWIGAPPPDPDHVGDAYWPIVAMESLPSPSNPTGDLSKLAILPLCRGSGISTGAFGWLDLDPNLHNLADEINGPLTSPVTIPDWFQTQSGDPSSVQAELEQYIHVPVLIPLHNQACQVDPGDTDVCPDGKKGVDPDPHGNNTYYYVHTVAVFYLHQVFVQTTGPGKDVDACASAPGSPTVPVTNGAGFLGCLKGWFVKYVISGSINPGGDVESGAIGIQLIH